MDEMLERGDLELEGVTVTPPNAPGLSLPLTLHAGLRVCEKLSPNHGDGVGRGVEDTRAGVPEGEGEVPSPPSPPVEGVLSAEDVGALKPLPPVEGVKGEEGEAPEPSEIVGKNREVGVRKEEGEPPLGSQGEGVTRGERVERGVLERVAPPTLERVAPPPPPPGEAVGARIPVGVRERERGGEEEREGDGVEVRDNGEDGEEERVSIPYRGLGVPPAGGDGVSP